MHSRGETRQTVQGSPPAQELCPWSGLPLLRFTMSISWSAAELEVAGVCPTLLNSSPAYILNLMSLLVILSIPCVLFQIFDEPCAEANLFTYKIHGVVESQAVCCSTPRLCEPWPLQAPSAWKVVVAGSALLEALQGDSAC